ncbi:hypothetical protein K449DRAFT_392462 [Hypoxylon sp. EC38]|nr:hypothetical protein K449DRAFT_392462 [Hypoxylon sp. EC38]
MLRRQLARFGFLITIAIIGSRLDTQLVMWARPDGLEPVGSDRRKRYPPLRSRGQCYFSIKYSLWGCMNLENNNFSEL